MLALSLASIYLKSSNDPLSKSLVDKITAINPLHRVVIAAQYSLDSGKNMSHKLTEVCATQLQLFQDLLASQSEIIDLQQQEHLALITFIEKYAPEKGGDFIGEFLEALKEKSSEKLKKLQTKLDQELDQQLPSILKIVRLQLVNIQTYALKQHYNKAEQLKSTLNFLADYVKSGKFRDSSRSCRQILQGLHGSVFCISTCSKVLKLLEEQNNAIDEQIAQQLGMRMKTDCMHLLEFLKDTNLIESNTYEEELTEASTIDKILPLYENICMALDSSVAPKLKAYCERQMQWAPYEWEKALFSNTTFKEVVSHFADSFAHMPDYTDRIKLYNAFALPCLQLFVKKDNGGEDDMLPLMAAAFAVADNPYFIRESILVSQAVFSTPVGDYSADERLTPSSLLDFSLSQLHVVLRVVVSSPQTASI